MISDSTTETVVICDFLFFFLLIYNEVSTDIETKSQEFL